MSFDNNSQTPPPPTSPFGAPTSTPAGPPVGTPPLPANAGNASNTANTGYAPATSPVIEGDKSFIATWLLSFLVGVLGADRFYLGKIGTGVLKLITLGGLGVWWLIDLIMVLTGVTRDNRGFALAGYREHRKIAWIVTGALVLVGVLINLFGGNPAVDEEAPPAVVAPAAEESSPVAEASAEPVDEASAEPVEPEEPAEPEVPAEYANALIKAESYSDLMHMSKAGIFDQLTSEYGEQFSAEAAQYAVDTMATDWNANALEKAKSYQDTMAMSPDAIHDQLTSEYGEQFTAAEADYAIAHLND